MAKREAPAPRRKNSLWPSRLWLAAGAIVVVGFILRPLGTYLGREFRYSGIVVIAIGAIVAVIAWADERWSRPKNEE